MTQHTDPHHMSQHLNTLTVRLIRSFEHRNWKPLVLRRVSLDWTTEELKEEIEEELQASPIRDIFKKYKGYDTLKIEYQPHGSKTNDALINKSSDPSLILQPGLKLRSQNIQNGTEVSYFSNEDYLKYIGD